MRKKVKDDTQQTKILIEKEAEKDGRIKEKIIKEDNNQEKSKC